MSPALPMAVAVIAGLRRPVRYVTNTSRPLLNSVLQSYGRFSTSITGSHL